VLAAMLWQGLSATEPWKSLTLWYAAIALGSGVYYAVVVRPRLARAANLD